MEDGGGWKGTELVSLSTTCIDNLPRRRKPFVKSDLFPDLEPFLAAERTAFDQAVDATVGEPVCVANVVESGGSFRNVEGE